MQKLIEQLINGMSVGSFMHSSPWATPWFTVYFSMINFAHGDIFMVGAYFGCFTITQLYATGLPKPTPF
jgi:branched-chain amino acid transport system permease protein